MKLYEALELTPTIKLDAADLQQRFYARSRQWHPDRFARASAEQQAQALDMTSVLNDAFRTLRDPVARAEYFLESSGLPPSKDVPPELLEEVFDLNMALEELRDGDAQARVQLEASRERFLAMRAETDATLATLAAEYDTSTQPGTLTEIRAVLNRRRYISNLIRDVEKELHVHLSN
jgi:molecular chaperone HscB